MKLTIIPSLLLIGALAAGCSSNDDRNTADVSTASTTTTAQTDGTMPTHSDPENADAGTTTAENKTEMSGSGTPETALTEPTTSETATRSIASEGQDGEVMAMLTALDNHEIQAATEAQSKASHQKVKEYATMMLTDHRANMQKTQSMAESMSLTSMDTPAVEDFKKKNSDTMATLTDKTGEDYDNSYMRMMARDHQEALRMIDNQLMPMAKSDEMKTHLSEVRKQFSDHLNKAEDIMEEL